MLNCCCPRSAATITVEADQPAYWGLLLMIPTVVVFVARITDEEMALRQELAGFDEYTDTLRYRLVPYVW